MINSPDALLVSPDALLVVFALVVYVIVREHFHRRRKTPKGHRHGT